MVEKRSPGRVPALRTLSAFFPAACWLLAPLSLCGCVEQTLTITSTPPGALVYLNDREIGRTPVTRDFVWYGDYDVALRLEGYSTLKTHQFIVAPPFLWVPLDFAYQVAPFWFHDHQSFSYNLTPLPPTDPQGLLQRAEQLRADTRPSRRPATQPAAR